MNMSRGKTKSFHIKEKLIYVNKYGTRKAAIAEFWFHVDLSK